MLTIPAESSAATNAGPPRRILIVEDHQDSLGLLAAIVAEAGFEAVGCASFGEAERVCEAGGSFDLLMSDITLRDGTGIELLRRYSHCFGGRAIAVTGRAHPAEIERVLEAGFREVITKPYDVDALVESIDRVASGS